MPLKAFIVVLLVAMPLQAQTKRALLIGINDYKLSKAGWPDLSGAVNDVTSLNEMLVHIYGFKDVVVLTDRNAKKAAILAQLDALVQRSAKNDIVLFYFAGHGSQVVNSKSDEPDKLDETLVPADSRVDGSDIRDKELRKRFNVILDKGARLSIVLDACHSGSAARTGAITRGVNADMRDLADSRDYGPRPETRGALVLAAAQDFERAYETVDHEKKRRGVFSWALMTSLRDAQKGEAAEETFLRARARVYAERPDQQPVLAGGDLARRTPFLGTRVDRDGGKSEIGIGKVRGDGTVLLLGGWANGLAPGTRLRGPGGVRLTVTAVTGLTRCLARVDGGKPAAGMLAEVVSWTAPPARKLRVWSTRPVAEDVEVVKQKADADYVLVQKGKLFAWERPEATLADARRSGLPVRTAWTSKPMASLAVLRKIHGWLTLQSPAGPAYPYRLEIRGKNGKPAVKVRNDETYTLHLKARNRNPLRRHVYVFTIDNRGRSVLLFGAAENRFPVDGNVLPEVDLKTTVRIEPPLGVDTWFLLTTEEPLPNPAVLEWDGVRAGQANWSVERLMVESVSGK